MSYLVHPHASGAPRLQVTSAIGSTVRDCSGKEYLDGMSGLWCCAFGFRNASFADAIERQLQELDAYHIAIGATHARAELLAERLCHYSGRRYVRVILVNSGSEATDTVMKLLAFRAGGEGRPILSFDRGYHGGTVGATSLTSLGHFRGFPGGATTATWALKTWRRRWEVACPESTWAKVETRALLDQVGRAGALAGGILEPVLGAGGIRVPPPGAFAALATQVRDLGGLVVVDEVITGLGRLGSRWGHLLDKVEPDIITTAKALGGGLLPIGAVILSTDASDVVAEYERRFGAFFHGFTVAGGPLACSVAIAVLDLLERPDFLPLVLARAGVLADSVSRLPGSAASVVEVRTAGLLAGVDLAAATTPRSPFKAACGVGGRVAAAAFNKGLLCRALGDTIALCPPLTSDERELAEMVARLESAVQEVDGQLNLDGCLTRECEH